MSDQEISRTSDYPAPWVWITPGIAAALPSGPHSEKPDPNCENEQKRLRLPEGGQYWPDDQRCPQRLTNS